VIIVISTPPDFSPSAQSKSERKAAAPRRNGKKGGRPRNHPILHSANPDENINRILIVVWNLLAHTILGI
jgi:hypothetical protein